MRCRRRLLGSPLRKDDVDVPLPIHGELRRRRPTRVGGENHRRGEAGAAIGRAAEDDVVTGETGALEVVLPDDVDVPLAIGTHQDFLRLARFTRRYPFKVQPDEFAIRVRSTNKNQLLI